MTANDTSQDYPERAHAAPGRFGFYSALVTTLLTIVSFGFALYAVPISGANCPGKLRRIPLPGHRSALSQGFHVDAAGNLARAGLCDT
jgi:hypothetical protein